MKDTLQSIDQRDLGFDELAAHPPLWNIKDPVAAWIASKNEEGWTGVNEHLVMFDPREIIVFIRALLKAKGDPNAEKYFIDPMLVEIEVKMQLDPKKYEKELEALGRSK